MKAIDPDEVELCKSKHFDVESTSPEDQTRRGILMDMINWNLMVSQCMGTLIGIVDVFHGFQFCLQIETLKL